METQKPISNTPMILGIIGGILGLPAAICSGACAAGISSLASSGNSTTSSETGNTFLWIGLIAAILGLVSAFLYKKAPKKWGIIMLIAGLLSGVTLITFNILSLIVTVLLIVGGAIALSQKNTVIAVQ